MNDILEQIKLRRENQLSKYSPEHDDAHKNGELAYAALCYLGYGHEQSQGIIEESSKALEFWPFREPFKPSLFCKDNLIESAALLVAEIERLERLENSAK